MRPDLEPRKKGTLADIIGVFGIVIDFDDADARNWQDRLHHSPNIGLETSSGRFQAFYLFDELATKDQASHIAAFITDHAKADKCSKDVAHVWRIAGTWNWPNKLKIGQGRSLTPQYVQVVASNPELTSLKPLTLMCGYVENAPTPKMAIPELRSVDISKAPLRVLALLAEELPKGERSERMMRISYDLFANGWSDDDIAALSLKFPKGAASRYKDDKHLLDDIKRLRKKHEETREFAQGCELEKTAKGATRANLSNTTYWLSGYTKLDGLFAYNELAHAIILNRPIPRLNGPAIGGEYPRQCIDADMSALLELLQATDMPNAKITDVHRAVQLKAMDNTFNPLRDHIEECAANWDGIGRVKPWLTAYLGVEQTEYTERIGEMFLVGLVARGLKPGTKVQYIMILEGSQGVGKSTVAALLGGKWFSENMPHNLSNKDACLHLQGKWLVELGELATLPKNDAAILKQFITKDVDTYRAPYDTIEQTHKRSACFIGTTNLTQYLRDETGNRRFWPVSVGTIDLDALARDRDMLIGEAVHLHRSGVLHHETRVWEAIHCKPIQESRLVSDPWEDKVTDFLENWKNQSGFTHGSASGVSERREKRCIAVADVAQGCLNLEENVIDARTQNRITGILTKLGLKQPPNGRKIGGRRVWEF
jgi:predicted P-loop ATPase